MKLNATTRAALRETGFTVAQWAALWGYSGEWGGDQCGCFDDRCALGFHHSGIEDCQCFPTMLNDAVAWRQAVAMVNEVRLAAASFGLFRYVTVTTPAVLAHVSTSQGGTGPRVNGVVQTRPAESVVRLEVREGWTAETGTDDNGRIVIRIVKAQEGAGTSSEDGAR